MGGLGGYLVAASTEGVVWINGDLKFQHWRVNREVWCSETLSVFKLLVQDHVLVGECGMIDGTHYDAQLHFLCSTYYGYVTVH